MQLTSELQNYRSGETRLQCVRRFRVTLVLRERGLLMTCCSLKALSIVVAPSGAISWTTESETAPCFISAVLSGFKITSSFLPDIVVTLIVTVIGPLT